jgi:sulfur carrier protein ThiS
MQIIAELVPRRQEEAVTLESGASGLDLLRALHLPLDAHLLVRGGHPIPIDEPLKDGERIRVIGVVSGGSA